MVIETILSMQNQVRSWKNEGLRIAFVPTMGCLHAGHLALVQRAREVADRVVVSIFVNPLQFGKNEDFGRYPRQPLKDIELLSDKAQVVFLPSAEELYPPGFVSKVRVEKLQDHLCGKSRPGHFEGVTTICLKLFQIVDCDIAIFGEKDFQQLRILEQMVLDLHLPLQILRHPTVRENDGLALSSRNLLLSPHEREVSSAIPRVLEKNLSQVRKDLFVGDLKGNVLNGLESSGLKVDYVEVAGEQDLVPVSDEIAIGNLQKPRIFVAAFAGTTRLIDNREVVVHG